MLYDTQQAEAPVRQQADLKVDRTLGDALLDVLQDMLSNQQQLRLAGEATAGLARPLEAQEALLERLKEITLGIRAANFTKLFRQMKALTLDVARRCDKEVDIRLEGAELAVDVAMLEALEDPLALLVRNAVELGLETPPERLAAGKPGKGRLLVRASCRHGAVRLEVHDDGKGPAASRRDAAGGRRGGLGRIEQAMAALHGSFCLSRGEDGGSVAACTIPLAFQFLDGVVFQAGRHRLVLDMDTIAAIQPLRASALTLLQQHEVLSCGQETLPFLDLASHLDGQPRRDAPRHAVLVTASSGERLALGVTAVCGRYRGAVSALAPCCSWHPALGGCVLLSGGQIGFALDVDALLAEGGHCQR